MAAGQNGHEEWVGSAYLFVESSLDKVVLSDAYAHPQQKVAVYRALQAALAALLAQDPSPVPTLPGLPFPSQGRGHRRLKRVGGSVICSWPQSSESPSSSRAVGAVLGGGRRPETSRPPLPCWPPTQTACLPRAHAPFSVLGSPSLLPALIWGVRAGARWHPVCLGVLPVTGPGLLSGLLLFVSQFCFPAGYSGVTAP